MESREYALISVNALAAKKGMDICMIDIGSKSSFADYLVLASGGSERQVKALADEVEDKMAKSDIFPKNIEGRQNPSWILMDYGDVVVNIFDSETREKYGIEKVWGDCETEYFDEI